MLLVYSSLLSRNRHRNRAVASDCLSRSSASVADVADYLLVCGLIDEPKMKEVVVAV